MIANEVVFTASAIADAVVFFLIFDAFFARKAETSAFWRRCSVIALAVLIRLSNIFLTYSFANAVVMILAASLCAGIVYRERWIKRFFIGIISGTFIGALEIVVLFLIAVSFAVSVSDIVHIPAYQTLGVIVSKWLSVMLCLVIRFKVSRHSHFLGKAYWVLFIVLLSSTITAVFLLFRINYEIPTTRYNDMALFASLGLLLGTLFALYLYERLIRQGAHIRAQAQYEQHMKEQLRHLEDTLAKQRELRRFKHDLTNKLAGLKGYLLAGDTTKCLALLDAMAGDLSALTPVFQTGNIALDATLSIKKALAENKGIRFETDIRLPGGLPLAPEDICVIFGNALDNAIEGCERVKDREQRISLALVQVKEHIFCEITNTAVEMADASCATSKEDTLAHGFGISSITEALAKYHCRPEITWENGTFSLSFILFTDQAE